MFDNIRHKIEQYRAKLRNEKVEKFADTASDKNMNSFIVALIYVSLVFDFLAFTHYSEHQTLGKIINVNYWISYGIGSLAKVYIVSNLLILSSMLSPLFNLGKAELDTLDKTSDEYTRSKEIYDAFIGFNSLLNTIAFLLLASLAFDIIQFTPLMKNKYVNKFASFNSHTTILMVIVLKIINNKINSIATVLTNL